MVQAQTDPQSHRKVSWDTSESGKMQSQSKHHVSKEAATALLPCTQPPDLPPLPLSPGRALSGLWKEQGVPGAAITSPASLGRRGRRDGIAAYTELLEGE